MVVHRQSAYLRRLVVVAGQFFLLLPSGSQGEVNCGGHNASNCELCPQDQGPSWCNGDCVWRGGACGARAGALNWVSCGGHDAASCSECHGTSPDEEVEWCHGDCAWDESSGRCVTLRDMPELDELLEQLGRLERKLESQNPTVGRLATFLRNAIVGSGSRQTQSKKFEMHIRGQTDRDRNLDALFDLLRSPKSDAEAKDVESLVWTALQWHSNDSLRKQMKGMRILLERGLLADALTVGDKILKVDPFFVEAWHQRAVALFRLGREEESLKQLNRALELEPRHFGALVAKGELLATSGSHSEARECLQKVRVVHPRLQCSGLEEVLLQSAAGAGAGEGPHSALHAGEGGLRVRPPPKEQRKDLATEL